MFTIVIMVGIGYAGRNSLEIIRRDIRIEHMAILTLLAGVAVYLLFIYFESKRNKPDTKTL